MPVYGALDDASRVVLYVTRLIVVLYRVTQANGLIRHTHIISQSVRTMAWVSVLYRSICRTLMVCLVCYVAGYHCTTDTTVNHALNAQLDALLCTSDHSAALMGHGCLFVVKLCNKVIAK